MQSGFMTDRLFRVEEVSGLEPWDCHVQGVPEVGVGGGGLYFVGADKIDEPVMEGWLKGVVLTSGSGAAEVRDDVSAVYVDVLKSGMPGEEVLDVVRARGLPMLVFCGDGYHAGRVAVEILPRTSGPVILGHLGCWPCGAESLKLSVNLARREERVFLETSETSIGNFLKYAVEEVPDKILYGSHSPECVAEAQWGHVMASVLDDESLRKVARGNAERVFQL